MPILSLALLALAVSLDGFGVGAMYGLRKIRIPLLSVCIISLCSGLIMLISMMIGSAAAQLLPPKAAASVGAVILIGIGLWAVVQMFRQRSAALQDASDNGTETQDTTGNEAVSTGAEAAESLIRTVIRIELKRLGLVIEILRTPALADRDRSGYISPSEAVLLGLALSLDAFGAGFGAAFIGFAPLLTAAVVVLASGSFLSAGLSFGLRFAEARWMQRLAVLPGFVLILMGVMKLM